LNGLICAAGYLRQFLRSSVPQDQVLVPRDIARNNPETVFPDARKPPETICCDSRACLSRGHFEEVVMTALVQAFYRASHTETETDVLKFVAMLCGAGLFVWLLCATYGLDLSPGFF
jgi:hypothetical protein